MSETASSFQPAVPAHESAPELTLRAVALGALLGIVFGAASTYLALRVGLTTSASVPIAVLAIWAIKKRRDQRAILEHNIVQTTGSAGESVASAVVFTVPALIFLGFPLQVGLTTLIAATGGMLGVLMMVPLRRYLIVKEHGKLRYPEGKACAEILQAGEKGGTSASKVFYGLGIGVAFKAVQAIFNGVKASISVPLAGFKGAVVGCDVAPELLGVGYIIGYRTSVIMVAGSLLASFILIPLILWIGAASDVIVAPGAVPIRDMTPDDVWDAYVRHIGAGAVAAGGIFALLRALPAIVSSLSASAKSLFGGGGAGSVLRTERDTPLPVLVLGALAIVGFVWLVPTFEMNLMGAALILVLGFLFAVVSSRITGEVGSSSCPLSGMTIGVLMATCGLFLLRGFEGAEYSRLALMIGAVICIAISNAGTCSQDLKTGFLVGATPVKQQGALLVGVLTSVLAVGWTAYALNLSETTEEPLAQPFPVASALWQDAESITSITASDPTEYRFVRLTASDVPTGVPEGIYLVDPTSGEAEIRRLDGIGAGKLRAPQAKLMSVVIDGLLTHKLPWDLILLGVAIAVFVELLGFNALTFAVGVYLPLAGTLPVFLGGLARKLADRRYRRPADAEDEPEGTLFSSGLIAGASILGIVAALLTFVPGYDRDHGWLPALAIPEFFASTDAAGEKVFPEFFSSDLAAACLLGLLVFLIVRAAAGSGAGAKPGDGPG
ncbi:MAG: oligopeptide transporter, OPT family [Planctomycetes bacterium]|nr:oligopeptide transporter, OPT family [Planctomycetota bacterium]